MGAPIPIDRPQPARGVTDEGERRQDHGGTTGPYGRKGAEDQAHVMAQRDPDNGDRRFVDAEVLGAGVDVRHQAVVGDDDALRVAGRSGCVLEVGDPVHVGLRHRVDEGGGVGADDGQVSLGQQGQQLRLAGGDTGAGYDRHRTGVLPHRCDPALEVGDASWSRQRCGDRAHAHAAEEAGEQIDRRDREQQHDIAVMHTGPVQRVRNRSRPVPQLPRGHPPGLDVAVGQLDVDDAVGVGLGEPLEPFDDVAVGAGGHQVGSRCACAAKTAWKTSINRSTSSGWCSAVRLTRNRCWCRGTAGKTA